MLTQLRNMNLRHTLTSLVFTAGATLLLAILFFTLPGGRDFVPLILVIGLLFLVLTVGVGIRNDLRRHAAIQQLIMMAEQLAEGTPASRAIPLGEPDLDALANAFNHMAIQTEDRMHRIAVDRSQLSAMLTSMADGVIIVGADGKVALMNRAAAMMLQTDPKRAGGRSFTDVARDNELVTLWQNCLNTGQQQSAFVERQPAGNGEGLPPARQFLSVVATPVSAVVSAPRTPGSQDGALVVLRDLSELRRLETVRRDFIANVSHELRTPLASIKLLVETLQEHALEDPDAARHFLDRIATEVDHMSQIVAELLDLSRIEGGRLTMQRQPMPVSELLCSTVERLRPLAQRQGLSLGIENEAALNHLPQVMADPERIRQVLTNLVHNAIKFTPTGGQVILGAKKYDDHFVALSVHDTGIGIAPEDVSRIFERFYKTDRARARPVAGAGGTGLGLAIAKHIVQSHGGTIWATSTEGHGSTFEFSLPIA